MTIVNAQPIPMNLIRTCFESQFYPELFKGHTTNDATLRLTGQLVFYTQDHDYIRQIVQSGLPEDYSGDTLEQLDSMIDRALEKDFDVQKPKKGKLSASAILLSIIQGMGNIELFRDPVSQTYISVPSDNGGKNTMSLSSTEAKRWLKKLYYDATGKPITTQGFSEALATIEAKAFYEGEMKDVFLRLGRHQDDIYLNIGDNNGTAIQINKSGYKVLPSAPIPFLKSGTMSALPLPKESSRDVLSELQALLDLDDGIFHRVLAFLIGCLKPEGPYLCFIAEGEQGSGKSFLTSLLKSIIDPSPAPKLRLPREQRELMIIAKQFYLLVFDNISGIKNDMSDTLCSLSTGGGFPARKLFTDEELKIFNECRPYVLNGISGVTHRADLLDRSISVRLPSMPPDKRKTEGELLHQFEELQPYLFDRLLNIASVALQRYDTVEPPKNIRMADAAKWLMAAEPATGLPEGSLINALQASQEEIIKETMDRNSLAVALTKMLKTYVVFDGTVGDLLETVNQERPRYDQYFPTTPSYLSKELDRLKPALKVAGIMIEFGPKKKYGKTIRAWLAEDGSFEEALAKKESEEHISY